VKALQPSDYKRKNTECVKKLEKLVKTFEENGGEILVMGGNSSIRTSSFYWALKSGAKATIEDYEAIQLPLFLQFQARIEQCRERKSAPQLREALQERLKEKQDPVGSNDGPVNNDKTVTKSVNNQRVEAVRKLLQGLSNESKTKLFTLSGAQTKNFWDTHHVVGWPLQLPSLLSKRLTAWTTTQCNELLAQYRDRTEDWKIVANEQHGKIVNQNP